MPKKKASKKKASKKVSEAVLILIAAATNLNNEMGLTGKDLIDLEGAEAELKKGITNAAKFIEDSDKFDDPTWDVLEELELVSRPAVETSTDLELMVGSVVTVDFDGEDYPGKVTKLSKMKATIEFEDGDTDEIAVADVTVVSNPKPEKKEAPKKKSKKTAKKAAKKEPEQEELPLEDIIEVGTKITADYDGEDYPGVVTEIDGDDATVDFEDDSTDTLPIAELTFVEAPKKKKAKPAPAKKKTAAKKAPKKKEPVMECGSRVSVDFDGEAYEGKVVELEDEEATVNFDDGTSDIFPVSEVTLLPVAEKEEEAPVRKKRGSKKETTTGDTVTVDFDGEEYEGVVIGGDEDEGFVVLFTDGTSETVAAEDFTSVKHLTGVRALKAAAYARYLEVGGGKGTDVEVDQEDISTYLNDCMDMEKIESWIYNWDRGYNIPTSAK